MKPHYSSSPNRPPVACVYMNREDLIYVSTWGAIYAAHHLVMTAVRDHTYKLDKAPHSSMSRLTTDDGLIIKSDQLDDILEYRLKQDEKEWVLPKEELAQLNRLRGERYAVGRAAATSEPRAPREPKEPKERTETPTGYTSLAALCDTLGVEPREARALLRKSTYAKPAFGWAFNAEQIDEVSKIIISGKRQKV